MKLTIKRIYEATKGHPAYENSNYKQIVKTIINNFIFEFNYFDKNNNYRFIIAVGSYLFLNENKKMWYFSKEVNEDAKHWNFLFKKYSIASRGDLFQYYTENVFDCFDLLSLEIKDF